MKHLNPDTCYLFVHNDTYRVADPFNLITGLLVKGMYGQTYIDSQEEIEKTLIEHYEKEEDIPHINCKFFSD